MGVLRVSCRWGLGVCGCATDKLRVTTVESYLADAIEAGLPAVDLSLVGLDDATQRLVEVAIDDAAAAAQFERQLAVATSTSAAENNICSGSEPKGGQGGSTPPAGAEAKGGREGLRGRDGDAAPTATSSSSCEVGTDGKGVVDANGKGNGDGSAAGSAVGVTGTVVAPASMGKSHHTKVAQSQAKVVPPAEQQVSLRAIKALLPEKVTFGQIKLVLALRSRARLAEST
eukprot:2008236-Pyramimonas_sp.AAC.1